MKRTAFAFLAAALLALTASVASAQYTDQLVTDTSSVDPGGSVAVSGDGFASRTSVDITIESTPTHLATVETDSSGAFSTTVTIPADIDAGTHTLKATGEAPEGGTMVLARSIQIGGDLSRTGTNVLALVIVGAAVFGIGLSLARSTRRSRHTPTH